MQQSLIYSSDVSAALRNEMDEFAQFVSQMSQTNSLESDHEFHRRLNRINELSLACPSLREEALRSFSDRCTDGMSSSALHQRGRLKPLGYSGDYLMIDWIYMRKVDSPGLGSYWDRFFHRQAAPKAVRNRKDYFCDLFGIMCKEKGHGIRVLNLASGPCRDIAEALARAGDRATGSFFHCVDVEIQAIEYGKSLLSAQASIASFRWEIRNVHRFRGHERYDLVWSAGLFDYLSDKVAIKLLKRMWRHVDEGGRLAVGNFHPHNPSRAYMEWCGNWFLIHRTEDEMLSLFTRAGISPKAISINSEPLGVCIFCTAIKADL